MQLLQIIFGTKGLKDCGVGLYNTVPASSNSKAGTSASICNHTVGNLKVQVIDEAKETGNVQRREQFWIKTLITLQPLGFNVLHEF